jgi:hypothetical protein
MSIKTIVSVVLFCLASHQLFAGDAVAMGFNGEGIWTAVTYIRSSDPKGGPHYHDAAQACSIAVRDLRSRAHKGLVRTKVIGQSDRTGYVTVARGASAKPNTGVTVIGRGKSQSEADKNAWQKLSDALATEKESVVYRYFSYGTDAAASARSKRQATTHSVLKGA